MWPGDRIQLCLIFLSVLCGTHGSHFRGAIITWKPGTTSDQIEIDYRISWRMSYASQFFCNDNTIQKGTNIGGTGEIECFNGCYGIIGDLYYQCTDYSVDEDWSSGRGSIQYRLPSSKPDILYFGFTGQAWIGTLRVGGGNWKFRVFANLTVRSDTSRINSSPTAEISPIVRLQSDCNHTIVIPVNDVDNDVIKCRWAKAVPVNECGGVCNGLPNSVIDEDKCRLSYSAVHGTGWFAVAIQVEDFTDSDSVEPLSSIPVQFLVQVFSGGDFCGKSSEFVYPTPPDDACIGVQDNTTFESAIVTRVSNESIRITQIKTISPLGMWKSALYNTSQFDWRMNITWSPGSSVSNAFCFSAVGSSGRESERRCITLLAGVTAPALVNTTRTPSGKVTPSQTLWSVKVDTSDFRQSDRDSYIGLYNDNDALVEKVDASDRYWVSVDTSSRLLTFKTSSPLLEKQFYYFLFDFGVIRGTSYCGAESAAITDPLFWRFRVRDVTPPIISFKKNPLTSNSTAELEWTLNEQVVNTTCTLTQPNQHMKTFLCDDQWSASDLDEGVYSLTITATDLEDNTARVSHFWSVDTTPPAAWFSKKPGYVSNKTPVYFSWTCPDACIPDCTLIGPSSSRSIDCIGKDVRFSLSNAESNQSYTFHLEVRDNVWNMAAINYTWITDFMHPKIKPCNQGQTMTVDCKGDFRPETVCNASVSDNMDQTPSLTYKDSSTGSCGFTRTWTSKDNAENNVTKVQNFEFVSNESMAVVRSPPPMSISCGSLVNMTNIFISMFAINHPCDLDVAYKFVDNASESCDVLIERTWTITDDCKRQVRVKQLIRVRQAQVPVYPEDGQRGIDLETQLWWLGQTSGIKYDMYLWLYGTDRPNKANTVIEDTVYTVSGLKPGTKYLWQVVFHYDHVNDVYLSPVWAFETRRFADLVLENIEIPSQAYTGQTYEIRWTVVNKGIATQTYYWYDAVYMSWTDDFQRATRIAYVRQHNVILSNDGYSSSARFTLDEKHVGNARFYVKADYIGYVDEYNVTNNLMQSSSTMEVILTPPPDLQVTSIRLPGSTFYSGKKVSVSWTVANLGQGSTRRGSWADRIWLSSTQTPTNKAQRLKTVWHHGNLDKDDTVTMTTEVTLPEFQFGDFFFLAEVDVYNYVFENMAENNNLYSTQQPVHVRLMPPPDLIVKSIDLPVNWTTGDNVIIKWTVENTGDGSPRSQPYCGDSVDIKTSTGKWYQNIGTRSHYGVLRSHESYTSSMSLYVSTTMASGNYNISVHTDIWNNVFEFTNDNNNILTKPVNIHQALPDLYVNNLNVTLTNEVSSKRLVAFWNVENIGNGKTLGLSWSDTLYIKRPNDNYFDSLGEFPISNAYPLEHGQSYTNNATIHLPLAVFGYISVMVEAGSEQFRGDDITTNNFYTIPVINIELIAADMVLQNNVEVSDTIQGKKEVKNNFQGGNDINVMYTVLNQGNHNVTAITWLDRIYFTENEQDTIPFKNIVATIALNEALNVGDSYTKTAEIKLPYDISGPYFVVVEVNADNGVFEGGKVANNRIVKLVNVDISPAADLIAQSLTVTDKGEVDADKLFSVIWEVKNIGNSMNELQMWTDKIFVTTDPMTNVTNTDLGTFTVENRLLSQSSYELQRNIIMPLKVSGNLFVCVLVDATQSVYESNSIDNNKKCISAPIFVKPSQGARLLGTIRNVTVTSQYGKMVPGSEVEIACNVTNVGDMTTTKSSWVDAVYIADEQVSTTAQLRKTGLRVKDVLHVGSLPQNDVYTFSSTVMIPHGFSGHPKFYVIPDDIDIRELGGTNTQGATNTNADNSSTSIETLTSYLSNEEITFLLPNLVVNCNIAFDTMEGGQPVTLNYNITNTGNITTFQVWYDSVVISDDYVIDAFDKKLKSELRPVQLGAGQTMLSNISFFIPLDLATKSYFLAIICDSRNDVFEENEDDNIQRLTFDMLAKASTDLFVKQVIAPESAEYGSTLSVTWEVANNGTKQARGYKCDSVYLSDDTDWDINDYQLGQPFCTSFTLDATQTGVVQGTVRNTVPHVKAQNYSTLVKTRSNIIDVLPANNVGISKTRTEISYKLLEFDKLKQIQLEPHKAIAFRIANVMEDKTLVVNVTSLNQDAFNSIYIKANRPATLYDFDVISEDPSSANHIITVPDTLNEDYYVLIENTGFISNSLTQALEVSVKYAEFEVMKISPEMLLVGAQTTIRISGTLFPPDMKAELHFNDSTIKHLVAVTRIFSSINAYATFSMPSNIPLTKAILVLRYNNGKDIKMTDNTVNIGTGTEGYLATSVENVGRVRMGETSVITVYLQNKGNSDLLSPLLTVQAVGGGSLRLLGSNKDEIYKHQHLMIGKPREGPSGIFRPGSDGELKFEAKQTVATGTSSMEFKVTSLKVSNENRNPFLDLKAELHPSHYNEIEWNKVWTNFIKLTGNSTLSLSRKVSEVLSDMSVAGRRVQKLDDITNYLIEFADAPYGERIILGGSLFNVATDSAITLAIDYTLPARIGAREQQGFLGKGWILPLWDIKIKYIGESTLTLTLEKEDYNFTQVGDNVFIHYKLGTITKVGSDMVLHRRRDDKEFHFDASTLLLKSIGSLIDNSSLSLQYKNNLLTQIKHSSGPYVSIVYNDRGNVVSMELMNSTLVKQKKKTFQYEFESGLLRSIRSDSTVTKFRYNIKDSSLKYVMYDRETMIVFEYNSFGHLSARRFIAAGDQVKGLEYTYSDGGMVYIHEIPDGKMTTYSYGEDGELIRIQTNNSLPEKTVSTMFSQATYLGDVLILKKTFDKDNNQVIIDDGNGDNIKTVFNDKGQLIEFIDGRGNRYEVDINDNGTLNTVFYPDGTNTSYNYFKYGHLTTVQSGGVKRYEFNEHQQLIKKTDSIGGISSYDYDEIGNVVTATNDIGEISIQQTDNQPARIRYPNHKVDFKYDNQLRVTAIETTSGYKVGYSYNRLGQMTQVTDEDGKVLAGVIYNNAGRIVKKTLGNKAKTEYKYDSTTGLLTKLLNYYPNGTLSSFFNYTYSSKNRRISVDTIEGMWKFRYDRAGQVISMIDPQGNVTKYTYDKTKNRKTVSVNGVEITNSVNELNQYVEYGKMKYKHDKNGNLVERESEAGEIERFVYDDDNKLIRYESALNNCTYRYDAFGFLYSKNCSDVVTQYVVNMGGNYGLDILEQTRTENGRTTRMSYYHGDGLIGLIGQKHENDEINYFMFDPLGSVVCILDENGDLLNKIERNPFGEILSVRSTVQSSMFTYIGQWGVVDMQEIPGTYLMRARLYDSHTGRFMSTDPVGIKAHSKNFYAYCSNDPVHFNDPEGTCPICWFAGVGAVYGLYSYMSNTPRKDWTWGGAIGSTVTGGLKGAMLIWRKVIPKPIKIMLGAGATVAGKWAQHAIDREPYSIDDAKKDYIDAFVYVASMNSTYQTFKKVVKVLDTLCSVWEKYKGGRPGMCAWPDKVDALVTDVVDNMIDWVQSLDPNDMLGPAGYGPARFIAKDMVMKYMIRFENEENATAPAQHVYIVHSYSEHLDPRTMQMGEFGFGNFTQEIPDRQKFFQGTINMTAEMGFLVRVFAGLDIVKKTLTWEFQTIDPQTGEAPIDPGVGFLPPNNGTTGQGFVSFSMKPRRDVAHLATINANASIYFDENEPIDAPNIFNTIDDIPPVMNSSIISETLSVDSVTISMRPTDSGSGPAFVDIFQKQDNSLVLFMEGVTEDILVLPLSQGASYNLLPISVDHVGNRQVVQELDSVEFLNVEATGEPGNCSCSDHGNCSWTNVCICNEGYYGPTCSSTTKPLEPPVLDMKAVAGFTNEEIKLKISARNMSGSLEDITIILSGFPDETTFSKGTNNPDGSVVLRSSDFGSLTMKTKYEGQIKLNVFARQGATDSTLTRSGVLTFMVYKRPKNVNIHVNGCFFNGTDGFVQARLNSSVDIGFSANSSDLLSHNVELIVPSWIQPVGEYNVEHVYDINDELVDYIVNINAPVQTFNVTVVVKLHYPGLPTLEIRQVEEISTFCNKVSTCDCVKENTRFCKSASNLCVCKVGWTGVRCASDVDECENKAICKNQAYTVCQNKNNGYDCLCRIGYNTTKSGCVADVIKINETVAPNHKKVRVSIGINIDLPPNVNLQVAQAFEFYSQLAFKMLQTFYTQFLGDGFVSLRVTGLRRGSLIIDHEVVMENNTSTAQSMSVGLAQLTTHAGQSLLTFDGQTAAVTQVSLDNKTVTGVCKAFTTINSCDNLVCEVEGNKPECRPPTEKDDSVHTIQLIFVAVGGGLIALIIIVTIVVLCRKSKKRQKKHSDHSVMYNRRPLSTDSDGAQAPETVQFSNLIYDSEVNK